MTDFLPNPDTFIGYNLVRVGYLLQRRFEQVLSEVGLSARHFSVLMHLSRTPGISSGKLSRLILVTPQSMGEVVAQMIEAGLIEREPARGRGHAMAVRPTASGEALLARAMPVVAAFETETRAAFGDAYSELNGFLLQLIKNPP